MPYKVCPECGRTSFSSCASKIWICPCCGQDLSAEQSRRTLGRGRLLTFAVPEPAAECELSRDAK